MFYTRGPHFVCVRICIDKYGTYHPIKILTVNQIQINLIVKENCEYFNKRQQQQQQKLLQTNKIIHDFVSQFN